MLTALPLAALVLFQAQTPTQPAPVFDLSVEVHQDTSESESQAKLVPAGWRILRGPRHLTHLSAEAWIERPQVQRGKWRRWPNGKDSVEVKLYPTPDVDQYLWRVVVYQRNEMSSFRVAGEGFREIAIGVSELFEIPASGGSCHSQISLHAPLQVTPLFAGEAAPEGSKFRYVFSYGPHGRPPRYARGDWDGVGTLPIRLSPFAAGRPATLELSWQSDPAPWRIGPTEFVLKSQEQLLPLPALPKTGSLKVIGPARADWSPAVGFIDQDGAADVYLPPALTQSSTEYVLPALRFGEYFVLESNFIEPGPPRRAQVRLDSAAAEIQLEKPEPNKKWQLHIQDWTDPRPSHTQLQIRALWGPFLWQTIALSGAAGTTEQTGTVFTTDLPSGSGFHYQAFAKTLGADDETTVYYWFGDAQQVDNSLQFKLEPTVFEVDGYEDGAAYTLRLLRDPHGPDFPPKLWMDEPMRPSSLSYLPLPFTNTLEVHGMPEGGYEASMWGLDRESGEIEELSYHYPFSD